MADISKFVDYLADRSRSRAVKRRALEQAGQQSIPVSATYKDYQADQEMHVVTTSQGDQAVGQLLTGAGLDAGDSLEWIDSASAVDAMPRYKPTPKPDLVEPDPEPIWAVLLKRRAYVATKEVYLPPQEAEYSDPVPASWSMVYRSTTFQAVAIAGWDPQAPIRYCEGTSLQLCGRPGHPDRDPYCRNTLADWRFIPQANRVTLGLPGDRCHYSFARAAPGEVSYGGYLPLGGIVIGCFAFSPNGETAAPTSPPYTLPRLYYKLDNPAYGAGEAPPGEAYLSCDLAQGGEVDLGWELVEVIPFSDYVPPRLTRPAFPGGVIQVPQYETQYWLFTAQGAIPVLTVEDYYYPPEAGRPQGYPRSTSVLMAIDQQGTIHLDFKIDASDLDSETVAIDLKHLQYKGSITEVAQSQSWRRLVANSPTESPLPGSVSHACVATYQAIPHVNISEYEQQLIQTPVLTTAELKNGKTVELQIWRLPPGDSCSLNTQPDQVRTIVIPPFDPASIGYTSQDQYLWNIAGFVAYA